MTAESGGDEFHFLGENPEDADEFLEQWLTHMLEHFSYERLAGCSIDQLNEQITYYNYLNTKLERQFMNPDFIFADERELYEGMIGEKLDIYDPLTPEQKMEIESVRKKINANFDKAREDARDRKFKRFSMAIDAIPGVNKLK